MIVYSMFESMDGEVNCQHAGCLTTFIRLAGCNLNCTYCDSRKALAATAGKELSVEKESGALATSFREGVRDYFGR